ncbi:hypothetical protein KW785_02545 [Candidatus Parcubacteria bacterium]|nr:hypothetical protein [Candidatus Parcubacteria bacterium]
MGKEKGLADMPSLFGSARARVHIGENFVVPNNSGARQGQRRRDVRWRAIVGVESMIVIDLIEKLLETAFNSLLALPHGSELGLIINLCHGLSAQGNLLHEQKNVMAAKLSHCCLGE